MMPRKPQSELIGGKSPRQRVWELARRQYSRFGWKEVTPGGVPKKTSTDYLAALCRAGYLRESEAPNCTGEKLYLFARDNGIEAPRVRDDGSPVTQGGGNEAMWGALGVLDTFDTRTLAELSGAALHTVKTYCLYLARAGYLTVAIKGGRGAATVYRVVKSRISGPRAPMITRLKVVYDPNTHQVVWGEGADEAAREMDRD